MATTITAATGSATAPTLVLGYQAVREVPTVLHRIIGRGDPDVTLVPAGLRTGTLELFYPDATSATAAVALLTAPGVFVLVDTLTPYMGMTFVVGPGQLTIRQDQDTARWTVAVPFAEVAT